MPGGADGGGPGGPGHDAADDPPEDVDLGYERPAAEWEPVDVRDADIDLDEVPRRFVDGGFHQQTVTCLWDPDGHPVPVLLAEVGGVCVRADGSGGGVRLVRESAFVQRLVSFCIDPFAWPDVEALAGTLAEAGLRLVPARLPEAAPGVFAASFEFEAMREQARVACRRRMECLEQAAAAADLSVPTLVDGRLGTHQEIPGLERAAVVGVVKRQAGRYLGEDGWRVLYGLEPGRRTPVFALKSKDVPAVSWYLKLDGPDGSLPNWGIVRVEVPRLFFEEDKGRDFAYADRLSQYLLRIRCRALGYARAPVSPEPVVRAEESLHALFEPLSTLAHRFYRLAGL
jgi:hypothetical protein